MKQRRWRLAVGLALLTIVLVGCGGDGRTAVGAGPSEPTAEQLAEFESLAGVAVPAAAEDVQIAVESGVDSRVVARMTLPRADAEALLDELDLLDQLREDRQEIAAVPDELSEDFAALSSYTAARSSSSEGVVAVHMGEGDPAVLYIEAFTV